MSINLQSHFEHADTSSIVSTIEAIKATHLTISVTDPVSVRELVLKEQGRARDEYALSALQISVLLLKQAQGQIDAGAVKREGGHHIRVRIYCKCSRLLICSAPKIQKSSTERN